MNLKYRARNLGKRLKDRGDEIYSQVRESDTALYAVTSLGLSEAGMDVTINNYLHRPFDFDKMLLEDGGMITGLLILAGIYGIKKLSDYRRESKDGNRTDAIKKEYKESVESTH